jgi:hypothetical protein
LNALVHFSRVPFYGDIDHQPHALIGRVAACFFSGVDSLHEIDATHLPFERSQLFVKRGLKSVICVRMEDESLGQDEGQLSIIHDDEKCAVQVGLYRFIQGHRSYFIVRDPLLSLDLLVETRGPEQPQEISDLFTDFFLKEVLTRREIEAVSAEQTLEDEPDDEISDRILNGKLRIRPIDDPVMLTPHLHELCERLSEHVRRRGCLQESDLAFMSEFENRRLADSGGIRGPTMSQDLVYDSHQLR